MYIEATNPIKQSDNHTTMLFKYYFVLVITIKGLQITVTHLNIFDTVRFSQCVDYSLEIDPTFWKSNITNYFLKKHLVPLKSIQVKHLHWPNLQRTISHYP